MSAKTDEILDSLKSLSLLEASELVKQIEETFGVSAAASAGVGIPGRCQVASFPLGRRRGGRTSLQAVAGLVEPSRRWQPAVA